MKPLFIALKTLVALIWAGAVIAVIAGDPQQQLMAGILILVLTGGHILEGLVFRRLILAADPETSAGGWIQILLFGIIRVAELHQRLKQTPSQA